MHPTRIALALVLIFPLGAFAQQRAVQQKVLTFPEAIEEAKKQADGDKIGAAISAMQAGIRDLQKKQRVAILEALPKPAGWEFKDQTPDDSNEAIASGMSAMGQTISREYTKGDQHIQIEVSANSPMIQMLSMLFSNPAMIQAQKGEAITYGTNKAILTKQDNGGIELQILMNDTHLIKVTSRGISEDDLLKIIDQSMIDRLDKPLGK